MPTKYPAWNVGLRQSRGFQISTLMRFCERPGGFVEIIIPQFVQKEKRQALE
nr:MAG TPA: hypothetical protein [Caudoviricetes sp.]